jgi:site-specific DNA-methyltransferase (adenine-specific)
MEYLIKTYTNENELILDFTSGSGTLAVACEKLNRRWICIEKDTDDKGNILGYCDITVERLKGVNRK